MLFGPPKVYGHVKISLQFYIINRAYVVQNEDKKSWTLSGCQTSWNMFLC